MLIEAGMKISLTCYGRTINIKLHHKYLHWEGL